MGASGNGKSYIACAFGMAACRNYYTVKYIRLPDLLDELAVARGEGIYKKVMKQYKPGIKMHRPFSVRSLPREAGTKRLVKKHWQMRFLTGLFMIPIPF